MAAADLAGMLSSDSEFSEPAIYISAAGTWRHITAIIDRNPPLRPGELERGLVPAVAIVVANDDTTGISAEELDPAGDGIIIARHAGEPLDELAEPMLLGEPAEQDEVGLTFRIGKRK